MARTSDKEIIKKLTKMKKTAISLNQFKVAAKINLRISKFYKVRGARSVLEWK